MMRYVLSGIGAGAASAFYLYFTYHPLLVHGAVHAAIFAAGIIAMLVTGTLTAKKAGAYVAGALPVHLAIHFLVIRDLQLIGVSQFLNFSSLP
ncbi:MAG: hypothetical protein QXJ74_11140 [Nitrososphaera sp.]|uniref:hypothetical protein n=1 Tax=Nitrososphaera sp. TaxID=1971748 RepID=UPI0017C5960F|nr:hypothetical protein [Nitrososphaera sp.]NWG36560.1 hypothetical protein [Nitrososphaera sp.]